MRSAWLVSLILAGGSIGAEAAAKEFAAFPLCAQVCCGPAPRREADYAELQRRGIRTVLDLRKFSPLKARRERQAVEAQGMEYVHVPIGFFPLYDDSVERALRIVTCRRRQPVYVHCKLGQDRAGLVAALYRVRCQGWTPQAAYNELQSHGFRDMLVGLSNYFWERTYR